MQAFQPLFFFNLSIPVWQILVYLAVISLFMLLNKMRFSLVGSYVFILFLLYYSFRGDLVSLTKEDFVVRTVYDLFGFVILGIGVFGFFFLEKRKDFLAENLKKRKGEIAELKAKAKKAEQRANALEAQSDEAQHDLHAQAARLKKILDAKIDELEDLVEEKESLLEKRNEAIIELKRRAEDAEKRAQGLETLVEESKGDFHAEATALKKKLEQDLIGKIAALEKRAQENSGLLEQRDRELSAFKSKAEAAEKTAHALEAQVEESQKSAAVLKNRFEEAQSDFETRASALKAKLEQELNAQVRELENQLKEKDGLLNRQNGEITDLKQKAEESEKASHALKTLVEELQKETQVLKSEVERAQQSVQTRESALKNKLEHELNARIGQLEQRVKEREGLLEQRAREVADFKRKAEEAEKATQSLKMQIEDSQEKTEALKGEVEKAQRGVRAQESALVKKLAEELNAKVDALEGRLKEKEGLLEKRNDEVANFKLKSEEAEKRAQVLKSQVDEAQKTAQALMAKVAEAQHSFTTRESAVEKKLAAELTAKIVELENGLKEKEGLLAKRNEELADLKLKAQEAEKKPPLLKLPEAKQLQGSNGQNGNEKNSAEQELKNKIFELKELQEQVNHKDGLLNLMAKRNRELADLKSKAEQRIEALEVQLKESRASL